MRHAWFGVGGGAVNLIYYAEKDSTQDCEGNEGDRAMTNEEKAEALFPTGLNCAQRVFCAFAGE